MSGFHAHGHAHGHAHSRAEALAERGSLTVRAALASVAMATVLVGLKSWAAYQTGSTAMLGSLADTGLDLLASLVTLIGVRVAAMPADDDHRFGHGKAEALVAMVQIVLISVSAIAIAWRAIDRLHNGQITAEADYGIGVSLFAIVATLGLLAYQSMVIRRTGSVAIAADNMHYKSDIALNLAVILALVLEQTFGLAGADPALGVIIAVWLLYGAYRMAQHVVDQLMDKEWPQERKLAFIDVVMRHADARGIHDLRTRSSGAHEFVQFHLWVRRDMTVLEAHNVMDAIEADLGEAFPGVEVFIHPDPEGHIDPMPYQQSEMAPQPDKHPYD